MNEAHLCVLCGGKSRTFMAVFNFPRFLLSAFSRARAKYEIFN